MGKCGQYQNLTYGVIHKLRHTLKGGGYQQNVILCDKGHGRGLKV